MSFDLRLPNITAQTENGKIEQIKSYLFQLVDQLRWALNSIESGGSKVLQQGSQSVKSATKESDENDARSTFNSVKSLIIKSADTIEAYYEQISERLDGRYVAKSDFGTYTEDTSRKLNETSSYSEELFANIQKISSDLEELEDSLIEVNARIKSGLLYYDDKGVPIYGLEIGQKNDIDGVEVFNKFARFTSDKLSFYDKNDTEVAYISDYILYITNAHITGTLTLGRFEHDTSDGLVCRWV